MNPEVSWHNGEFDGRKVLLSFVLPKDMTLYVTTSRERLVRETYNDLYLAFYRSGCSHSEGISIVIRSLKDQVAVAKTTKEEAERVAVESLGKIHGLGAQVKLLQEASSVLDSQLQSQNSQLN